MKILILIIIALTIIVGCYDEEDYVGEVEDIINSSSRSTVVIVKGKKYIVSNCVQIGYHVYHWEGSGYHALRSKAHE